MKTKALDGERTSDVPVRVKTQRNVGDGSEEAGVKGGRASADPGFVMTRSSSQLAGLGTHSKNNSPLFICNE